jgi:glutathione S-transferase
MTPRPLLYTYRRCPYAMRARMALIHTGIAFDAFEIILRDKPAPMLAASPKGTVPVLVLPDGSVIEESLEIMQWALTTHGDQREWSRSQAADNLAIIADNDGQFKQLLDRYKYPERFSDSTGGEFHRNQAVQGMLQTLERRLSVQPFLGDALPCAADWATFPFVRQFRAVDEAWFDAQALPATQRWLSGWLQSDMFALCMRKLPTNERISF